MLTRLIEEARAEMIAAQDESYKKFDEYMSEVFSDHAAAEDLKAAMDRAWDECQRAEGVLEGLLRAQKYLNARATA